MFPIFMIISALAVKNDPAKEQQNAKNDEYASKYFASFIIKMVINILTKIKVMTNLILPEFIFR